MNAATTVAGIEYVNVDTLALQLGARDVYQVSNAGVLGALYEEAGQPSGLGVIKRLLAAFRSAANRGNVTFATLPVGRVWWEDNGTSTLTCSRLRVTISSNGGHWSSRSYRMVTVVTVHEDEYGVTGWWPSRGTALVEGNGGRTVFGGHVISQLIGHLYFGRGLARNLITDTIQSATTKPTPAWHTHARGQLADLACWDPRKDLQINALHCIANAMQAAVIAAVQDLVDLDTRDPAAARGLLLDDPHDWAADLAHMLQPAVNIAEAIIDRLSEASQR